MFPLYLKLFVTFFKIGLFTIGGGYAMIPLIQEDVIANGWMTMDEFAEFVGVAESTPGPFAVNIATFCGMHTAGITGAVFATTGVFLPSLLIILVVARCFVRFSDSPTVKAAIDGTKPVIIGLIFTAVVRLFLHNAFGETISIATFNWVNVALAAGIFIFAQIRKTHPIALIFIGAICGIMVYGLAGAQP